MSVLIKGMEPSNRCLGCKFEIYGQYCFLLGKYTNNTRAIGRLDNCPVVGLPEKHGRLIDGDELFKQMNTAIAMMSGMMKVIGAEDDEGMQMELKAYRDIRDGIKDCDTVIEAEGKT